MITVVKANALHSSEMAGLLNQIIEIGGTTAISTPVTSEDIASWMDRARTRSAWHVAELAEGKVVGFQWIEPADYLPDDAAEIATFARVGHTGLGIGSSLFKSTVAAARALGYRWINANIRSDNKGGIAYYQSRGFETYGQKIGVRMDNGQVVDKVLKRFDL
ncbi:MAG: GNAT family N-acetyltransferase [Pseudomonadota bacterium]